MRGAELFNKNWSLFLGLIDAMPAVAGFGGAVFRVIIRVGHDSLPLARWIGIVVNGIIRIFAYELASRQLVTDRAVDSPLFL